ncbi:glycosyltransferase [Streptomyces sp. NPDC058953]|uniref:glycosyltransferase family protein n=1 Tax=Streptomyces sp. NPDC058953 TaxID=3346676 RepID=UPI00367895BE
MCRLRCRPGVDEIITDGDDGPPAPPGDPEQLAHRLGMLVADEEMREAIGERARRNIRRYSTDRIVSRWENLFALLER